MCDISIEYSQRIKGKLNMRFKLPKSLALKSKCKRFSYSIRILAMIGVRTLNTNKAETPCQNHITSKAYKQLVMPQIRERERKRKITIEKEREKGRANT